MPATSIANLAATSIANLVVYYQPRCGKCVVYWNSGIKVNSTFHGGCDRSIDKCEFFQRAIASGDWKEITEEEIVLMSLDF